MPPRPFHKRLDQQGRAWMGAAFGLAVAFRLFLVLRFPTIHGGDAAARIANADTLVLGYQLPLPQLFVVLGKTAMDDPLLVRWIFCLWGGILAAGVTALLATGLGSRTAMFGALLLPLDPLLAHYSIVPYQEPVAYGLLAWAFVLAAGERERIAACLMAAACLSRFEAWLFLPAFFWATRSGTAALIALSPVAGWTLWWQGLAPSGLYVLDLDPGANRISRVLYLSGKLLEYETGATLILAGLGLLLSVLARNRNVLRVTFLLALAIAVVTALGHEYPPGSGLMSERLIHLPVLLALSLAALALGRISETSRVGFALCLMFALLLAGRNLRFEAALLKAAANQPDLALARDTARAIEVHRTAEECVSVSAPAVDPGLLLAYVLKVDAALGDVTRARERAAALAGTSPDRDRIAAHLKARPGTIRSEAGCPLSVVVDGAEFTKPSSHPRAATLLAEVTAGPRQARLLRIHP